MADFLYISYFEGNFKEKWHGCSLRLGQKGEADWSGFLQVCKKTVLYGVLGVRERGGWKPREEAKEG